MDFESYRAEWVVEVYGPKLPPQRKLRDEARRKYGTGYGYWQRMVEQRHRAKLSTPKDWIRQGRAKDLETCIAKVKAHMESNPKDSVRIRNTRTEETIPAEALQ